MVNKISEIIIRFLIHIHILKEVQFQKFHSRFKYFVSNSIIISVLLLISNILDYVNECITICIVFNVLRLTLFKKGFHAKLNKCYKLSLIYFTLLSYMAHSTASFFNWNEIICAIVAGLISVLIMDLKNGKRFFNWFCKFL